MAKGGLFERQVCRRFSLWWSGGKDDDLFWRTAGSGGRATVRGREGKTTRGHYGDVYSTDRVSRPFTELVTVEVKRGYSKRNRRRGDFMDLIDALPHAAPPMFAEWVGQAVTAARYAGTPYWMIVHRRDSRDAVVYFPGDLYTGLAAAVRPILAFNGRIDVSPTESLTIDVVCTRLSTFLRRTQPANVIRLWRHTCHSRKK